jgi:arsenate reductase-like glutaredoxin family protein
MQDITEIDATGMTESDLKELLASAGKIATTIMETTAAHVAQSNMPKLKHKKDKQDKRNHRGRYTPSKKSQRLNEPPQQTVP